MLTLIKGDITTFHGGAVVNAANSMLLRGGGVCGAIFAKAGPELDEECATVIGDGEVPAGNAKITKSYQMKNVKAIIHAVGPRYLDGKHGEPEQLASAYRNAMRLMQLRPDIMPRSIAFPFISAGIYGYPAAEAARIAVNTLKETECASGIDVTIYAFSDTDYAVLKSAMNSK